MAAPNFVRLDAGGPEISRLVAAMLPAREAVSRRLWSQPQEYANDDWWADVLADPRGRRIVRAAPSRGAITIYRLRDEPHATVLVACTKCEWRAAFKRDD